MNKTIIKSFTKITILTLIFFILFNLWNQALNAWWWSNDKKTENADNFTSIDSTWLNEIWVALNVNIWTKFYEWKVTSDNWLYNDIVPISLISTDPAKTKEILITKNIDAIKDYVNISKINIKWYLDSWENKQETYNSLINQLKIRYITWYANSKNLKIQIESLVNTLNGLNQSIENTKQSIDTNMKSYNSKDLNKNIDDYMTLKNQYTQLRTYAVICNQFLKYYTALNAYNRDVLTTLKLNENAIVNNSYVVIPNSWTDLIKSLNLIYDENALPENLNSIWSTWIPQTTSDTSINSWTSTSGWLLWDPFNLQNKDSEIIKQTWDINFWADKLDLNKK